MVQLDSKEGTGLYRHYLRGDAMDIYFYNIGLFRKPVANDEFSLFRCVSEQVYHSQHFYLEISAACQDYLSRHEFPREASLSESWDHYVIDYFVFRPLKSVDSFKLFQRCTGTNLTENCYR